MNIRQVTHLAALILLFAASEVQAQSEEYWKVIGEFQMKSHDPDELGNNQGYSGWGITCAYFWDENSGLVGLGNGGLSPGGHAEIWRTTDGGQRWEKAQMPSLSDTERQGQDFHSVWMLDKQIGWAALNFWYYTGSSSASGHSILLKTTDGGKSWNKDLVVNWPEHLFSRAKQLPSGRMVMAQDVAIVDDRIAIANNVTGLGAGLFRSIDGGVTWQRLHERFKAVTIYWDQVSRQLFASSYQTDYQGPLKSPKIHVSNDLGITWKPLISEDPFQTNLHIDGTGRAIYLQSNPGYQFLVKEGFYRSLNGGKNWKHVGGPNRASWTRFHVPASCNGALVIGFDSNKVWMTTAGGDGAIRLTHPPILNVQVPEPKPSCDSQQNKILLDNIQCSTYVFTSAALKRDEGLFALQSGGVLPINLQESGHGELIVKFLPNQQTGFFDDSVVLHGYEETKSGRRYFDTAVYISATSIAVAPQLTADQALVELPATSTCYSRDTTVTLTNTGCDTLTLHELTGSGTAYSYSQLRLPVTLAPGASVQVKITFHPLSNGNHSGNLRYTATQQGLTTSNHVTLTGVGYYGEGSLELLSSKKLELPELTFCAPASDTLATIRNTGCDTLIIRDVNISGAADYLLPDPVQRVTLAPDSSFRFLIRFAPQGKGTRSGTVTISWTDERDANLQQLAMDLTSKVLEGSKILSTPSDTFNIGEANICLDVDSSVRFTNDGCDTLIITGATIDAHFIAGGSYPITLAPGQSIEVPVISTVDTAGKPVILGGKLTLTSTADNTLAPIVLTRGLVYPTKLRLEAVDDASGKDGDVVTFKILLEGDVPSSLSAIHFDFIHNNDLLGFVGLTSQDLTIASTSGDDPQVQRFTLSPVRGAGELGEIRFRAFVTDEVSSVLSFDNISFEAKGVSFAPECLAVISDSGSHFDFVYQCGDRVIRDLMKGELLIKSLTPNPAANEIRLELASGVREANIVIVDMLGAEVLRTSRSTIDISHLASGTYYLRVSANGAVQTRRVIVQR